MDWPPLSATDENCQHLETALYSHIWSQFAHLDIVNEEAFLQWLA